jgi:hypothetical protein
MEIVWEIQEAEIIQIKEFIRRNDNPVVKRRFDRNVKRQSVQIDEDAIIRNILMCLLTSQQRSGPTSRITYFLKQKPFPLTFQNIEREDNIEAYVRTILRQNGLTRYINKIPRFFEANLNHILKTKWEIIETLKSIDCNASKNIEREIADEIDDTFVGFGPKQSRNFLQSIGLTKYEIPIDSRITKWLNDFGFPVTLSSSALQDKGYYHFVSDGIQELCIRAEVYPCILDAAIFSSFDKSQWTEENTIY